MKTIFLTFLLVPIFVFAANSDRTLAQTNSGPVRGVELQDVLSFKAIPYAAPPVGDLRWAPPQPPTAWTQPLNADHFRSVCPQMSSENILLTEGDEDCLTLNVWRPAAATAKKLPVMVFIHGGANMSGSTNVSVLGKNLYDGAYLAADRNVVLVTIQYRLGVLGFLSHQALSKSSGYGSSGNYATLDQILALRWVQKNIAQFAGDPGNVTVFGQSAGAASTLVLMASPLAKGLFQRAIIESGYNSENSLADAEKWGAVMANSLGCGDDEKTLACLKAMPAEVLVRYNPHPETIGTFVATVDGHVLDKSVAESFRDGSAAPLDFILGTTTDEMTLLAPFMAESGQVYTEADYARLTEKYFGGPNAKRILKEYPVGDSTARKKYEEMLADGFFQCSSRRLARAASAHGQHVYKYVFSHVSDNPLLSQYGAFHGSELPLVFHTLDKTEREDALSEKIGGFWTNFAKTGNPGAPWPQFKSGEYLDLNLLPVAASGYHDVHCDFWDQIAFPKPQ
jgi:para-nitrobenzyl esterase